tara:strand:+ start:61280 stop:61426 length:147 start_codon:yes stop_codon:yes gene_type:complete
MLNRHEEPPSPVRVYTLKDEALLEFSIDFPADTDAPVPVSSAISFNYL